tara:strand:- start:160 stop:993 length:834 start_codon:yes stop_codon:yes gene_type:complete
MIDRKEFTEELQLRETVQKAIKVIKNKKTQDRLDTFKEESKLRTVLRDMLQEGQAAVAAIAKHASTGINALEDLLKNSNVLFVLETGYKSLTTDKSQRDSYRSHILAAVKKSLAPESLRKNAGEDVEISEAIDISVSDKPEDDPDFINVEDEEEVEVDEKDEFGLDGEDLTGRNRAFTDFGNIEKDILTAFDNLDNPEDIRLFEEYLIKNLALYFDKYETELDANVEEPPEAAEATADAGDTADLDDDIDSDTEAPAFELEEVLSHLDLDDIIKNLL